METISEPYRLGADVICSRLLRARPASPLGRPLTLHLTVMGKGGLLVKGMWQLQFVSGTGGHARQQRSGCVAYCWRSTESLDEHTYRAAGGQPLWGERSRGSGDVSCITTSPAFTLRVHLAVWPAQPLVPSLQSMPPPSASRHLKEQRPPPVVVLLHHDRRRSLFFFISALQTDSRSLKIHTPTVVKLFQTGLCEVVEADSESGGQQLCCGFIKRQLYIDLAITDADAVLSWHTPGLLVALGAFFFSSLADGHLWWRKLPCA